MFVPFFPPGAPKSNETWSSVVTNFTVNAPTPPPGGPATPIAPASPASPLGPGLPVAPYKTSCKSEFKLQHM